MKIIIRLTYFVSSLILFCSCSGTRYLNIKNVTLADELATPETKLLFKEVEAIGKKGIAIGHQDATAYGLGWKASAENPYRNDLHDITGKYPAVNGWELGHIELANNINLDTVSFSLMRDHIIKSYALGAINTLSWHLDNPESGGSSWDVTPAAASILKGGANRQKYEIWVNRLADFLKSLKTADGKDVPVVFRPYHEMNGSWFWWGANNCTVDEYKQLFRDIVIMLKEKGVHNVLYAYAPNTLNNAAEYEHFYPGDDYVDIMGVDIYNHSGDDAFITTLQANLKVVKDFAMARKKPFALTETGNVKPGYDKWFTEVLYKGIENSGISWVLFWRNARKSHYFATFPTEPAAEDFKELGSQRDILFLEDLQKLNFKIKK
ncbi:MAG: glycosyl hydrolase [Leeuwenhoekiella sp.]